MKTKVGTMKEGEGGMPEASSRKRNVERPISYQETTRRADLNMITDGAPVAASTQKTMQPRNEAHSATAIMEMAVVIPTLNEGENIVPLLEGIFAADERLQAVVVDDGSRDGTAEKAREFGHKLAQTNGGVERVHIIDRGRKLGYASAIQDGMRYALRRGAKLILQMDADFSHDPKYIPEILRQSHDCDLVIGSRYIPGGGTENWGMDRKILSGGANSLVRFLLNLSTHDCTGGFRCWKRELIESSGLLDLDVQGYAFQFMILDLLKKRHAVICEVPIIFVDRQFGKSKLSRRIIFEAGEVLFTLWFQRLMRRVGLHY
jgi:dolichol-phosphate mannosyltransferase